MNKTTLLAAAGLAVLALAGCGSAPQHATAQPAHSAASPAADSTAPSPTVPEGCDQVSVVVGTVRGELENAPTDSTFNEAMHQLASLGRSLPEGALKLNVDKANFELGQYWERLGTGENATKWAKAFAADLRKLESDCA